MILNKKAGKAVRLYKIYNLRETWERTVEKGKGETDPELSWGDNLKI